MTHVPLRGHFNAVLAAWIRVEAASKFEHGPTNLPSCGRPTHVGTWIGGARGMRGTADPKVTDAAVYVIQWQTWWDGLQLEWRKKEKDGKLSTKEHGAGRNKWGPLTQWGVNGTLSIVALLYFWGCVVPGDELEAQWEAAVLDVAWVLEGLTMFYEKF
ncbi:hypothetical protein DFH07DRAFT_730358 [Mycena maculata]|uniref:Uncharacterized protein n=1 Tax=Mycena maculata TaxID=230809 RepID=A0AAD7K8T8_9AGAR|nr:hypothetical protein DFH07DRAFT_730358 [Mycena maculata]